MLEHSLCTVRCSSTRNAKGINSSTNLGSPMAQYQDPASLRPRQSVVLQPPSVLCRSCPDF
ncbi:hypothetical protein BaRGS_00033861, partial [Batillaria attramentaria]